ASACGSKGSATHGTAGAGGSTSTGSTSASTGGTSTSTGGTSTSTGGTSPSTGGASTSSTASRPLATRGRSTPGPTPRSQLRPHVRFQLEHHVEQRVQQRLGAERQPGWDVRGWHPAGGPARRHLDAHHRRGHGHAGELHVRLPANGGEEGRHHHLRLRPRAG